MTARPIIFSPPMVRALLDGRKTQTRRIIKPQPPEWAAHASCLFKPVSLYQWSEAEQRPPRTLRCWPSQEEGMRLPFTLSPRTRLWVREAWRADDFAPDDPTRTIYRADAPADVLAETRGVIRWRPSIHMSRARSRLALIVTDVRVQRLQDISEEDAEAEGVETDCFDMAPAARNYAEPNGWFIHWGTLTPEQGYVDLEVLHRRSFRSLWEHLHGPDAWTANPWVACIHFTAHPVNIDALQEAA